MNAPESSNTFVPKQALSPTPQLYDELTGDGLENLAKASLALIGAIPSGAIVHDNGCGTGAATAAIMEAISSSNIDVSIKATDIFAPAIEVLNDRVVRNGWPVEGTQMDSNKLSFPDDTFSHSISNALLFTIRDNHGIEAVKETYRTLKPGGIAVMNCFHHIPHMASLRTAHQLTRPAGTPPLRNMLEMWEPPEFIAEIVEKGGFEKSKIATKQVDFPCTTADLHRFVTIAWSFIAGTSAAGWLESDEENWDKAIEIFKEELRKTGDCKELDGKMQLKFVANVVVATK